MARISIIADDNDVAALISDVLSDEGHTVAVCVRPVDGLAWTAAHPADLILVDLRKAHLVPLLRVVSCFVHQGQARDVEAVMVDGRWLMRDGIVRTMDEGAIVREADRIGRAAWRRLFEERPALQPPPGLNWVQ